MNVVWLPNKTLTLMRVPLPPSVNKMYAGIHRRYATKDLVNFKKAIEVYRMENKNNLHFPTQYFSKQLELPETCISIERLFFVHRSRIITKSGDTKSFDVTNYIKALDDAVASITGIDDKHFWMGSEMKVAVDDEENENVTVRLKVTKRPDVV